MFTVSFSPPSSSSIVSFLSHTARSQLSVYSHAAASGTHECFFLVNFSAASSIEIKPVRATKHLLTQCGCLNSLTDLYTDTGFLYPLFRELGINEEETKYLILKNPSLKLSSLDEIRSRLLSLQSLGITGIALFRLVTKYPNVLTAEEVDPLIRFLLVDIEGKLEVPQVERLLTATEARFLAGFDRKVRLLLRHGVPNEKIAHVLNNVNLSKALCKKSLEDIQRTINFLQAYGGMDLIVRRPLILNYDLDTQLIPKVTFLLELSGGDENGTGMVLRRLPAILSYSLGHLENHVEFLRSFAGLNDLQIFKIILVFPNVISASKERKLHPRIEFLKQCGLDSNDIFKFLTKAPLFLALSFEDNLAHKLGILVKIGYKYRTKELAMAVGSMTRTSCENMQKVIGLFLDYGLSCADILAMSKKHPQVLQYSHGSLREKMEYLIKEMGREVEELLVFPAFLGYKLDGRIKHRYEAKRKTRGENMSLNKLLTVSAEQFKNKETSVHDCLTK